MTEAPRTAAPPPSVDDAREEGRRRARHRHSRQGRGSGDGSRGDAVLPAAGRTVDGPWTRRHGRAPPPGEDAEGSWGRSRGDGPGEKRRATGGGGRRRARRARRRPRRVAGETVRGDPADDVDGGDDGDGDGVRRSGGKTRRGGERGDDRWDRGRCEASSSIAKRKNPSITAPVDFSCTYRSGGPFGTEPSIKAAGNLYAIIGFVLMPIVWMLPEAVMTYELSLLYPCASGGVRWTEEAFGEFWGLIVGYLVGPEKWLQTPDGDEEVFDDDSFAQQSWFPNSWMVGGIAIRPFVNNMYWNYSGLDQVMEHAPTRHSLVAILFSSHGNTRTTRSQAGHYSNSVSEGTLRNGIVASSFLVSVGYLLVALVATGATDMEQGEWNAGAFAMAATKIAGPWLGRWIVIAAGMSLLAQFISGMSANSLQIQGMAARGQLPSLLSHQSARGTPTCAILLGALVILALLPLPFSILVELQNFTYCINVLLEFLAFAQLRIRRDCTIPWKVFYSMMLVVPLLLSVAVLLLSSYTTYIYGASVTAFGIILIYVKRLNYDRQ
ncbi:hypothetical protein ACHAWF_016329 [Thalassiosira exigua]